MAAWLARNSLDLQSIFEAIADTNFLAFHLNKYHTSEFQRNLAGESVLGKSSSMCCQSNPRASNRKTSRAAPGPPSCSYSMLGEGAWSPRRGLLGAERSHSQ